MGQDEEDRMITRRHLKGDAESVAVYSACEAYRYQLMREWQADGRKALFVMLNPSTATEVQNDPTVERCERRARALGFGAFRVVNIFAYRATEPKVMRAQQDPVGPANNETLAEAVSISELLDGLPYKSRVMTITEDDWVRMSISEQQALVNDLYDKLERYQRYNGATDLWVNYLGTEGAGNLLYPMLLDDLP